jgi:hypothetical protein
MNLCEDGNYFEISGGLARLRGLDRAYREPTILRLGRQEAHAQRR